MINLRQSVWCALALVVLSGTAAGTARADQSVAPPSSMAVETAPLPWSALNSEQQRLLQRFEGNRDTLPAARQNALARGSDRWLSMTPEQRDNARSRFKQWRDLEPGQREAARRNWKQFQDLSPEQKQRVRAAYKRFQKLPVERRMELRRKWQQLSAEERRERLERLRDRAQQRRLQRP